MRGLEQADRPTGDNKINRDAEMGAYGSMKRAAGIREGEGMNIKSLLGKIQWRRDLIRLWVAGTVAWAALWLLVAGIYPQPLTAAQLEDFVLIFVGVPAFFWALLFAGFWIASGFTREQSK